jgi:hypothetical protein
VSTKPGAGQGKGCDRKYLHYHRYTNHREIVRGFVGDAALATLDMSTIEEAIAINVLAKDFFGCPTDLTSQSYLRVVFVERS